jgi:hypothetical protein
VPFKSQKQRAYLYATHPKIAAEFEAKTPKGKKLPVRVGTKKTTRKKRRFKS